MERSRASYRSGDELVYELWLVFGLNGEVRLYRTRPSIGPQERRMKLTATLPTSLFETPELSGTITIPDDADRAEVLADVEARASALLREQLGVSLALTVNDPGDETGDRA
jgi:hypothetical protein